MTYVNRSIHLTGLLALLASPLAAQAVADSGTFVVRHSGDTVATETFSREATTIKGTLSLNNFRHTSHRYTAVVAPDASVPMIDISVHEDADSGRIKARVLQRARIIFREDSAAVDAVIGQAISTQVLGTQPGAIPYLNMSFALLEQAVRRSRAAGGKEVPFFNLAGGQTVSGTLTPLGKDSLALDIGDVEFRLKVDGDGRVLGGVIPTQNVQVDRH